MPRLHAAVRMAIAEPKRLKAVVNWGGQMHSHLAGQTSLADALGLIASARAVVSNDSGLMHVAAGFSVPQVAVLAPPAPTTPRR